MRHKLKIITLWIAAVSLSLAVLVFALSITFYYVLQMPSIQERALRIAEEKVSELGFFNGDITIERLESNLISYIDLYGVRGVGKSGYGDSVYVGHVTARYWLPPLLRRTFRVRSAVVTDVRAHVVMSPDNDVMIPFVPSEYYDQPVDTLVSAIDGSVRLRRRSPASSDGPPDPSTWAWKVAIGRAWVNGINAVYRDLSNDMVGEIKNARAEARFYAIDSFYVELRVPEGSYESPWWSGEIDTIGVSGVITWKDLEVHSLLLKGAGTRVTAAGKLSYYEGLPWDIHANFMTSIRPLPVLYENAEGLGKDGVLEGTASFKGTLYEPIYNARVKGYGVVYQGYELASFDVEASYGTDEYGRARIRGGTGFGQFDVNASLLMKSLMRGEPEFGDYTANVFLSGLDAKKIAEELKVDLPLPISKGQARLKADGMCFEIPHQASLTAEFDGEELVGGPISVGANLKNDAWSIDGNWGTNSVEGHGKVDFNTLALNGTVSADLSDPSAVTATLAKEHVRGRVEASAKFAGRIDAPEKIAVSAQVKGGDIRWRGILADSLEALITVENGKAHLQRADGRVIGRIDSVAAYFDQGTVDGYIDVDVSMKGGFDNPIINARLRGRDLRYDNYALDTLSGFASMENNVVRWNSFYLRGMGSALMSSGRVALGDNMELSGDIELFDERADGSRVPAGKLTAKGSIFEDTIRGSCRLTSLQLRMLDRWIPEEHSLRGTLALSGEFSGTTANPGGRVNFQLTKPSYAGHSLYSVVGDAALADSSVSAAVLLRVGGSSSPLELKALVPFLPSSGWNIDETGKRPALVSANTDKFDLGELSARFLEPDCKVVGSTKLDAGITLKGGVWNVGGSVSVPYASVRYAPQDVSVDSVNLNVRLSGTLEKPRAEFTLATGRASMETIRMDRSFTRGESGIDTLTIDSARFVFRDSGFVDVKGKLVYGGLDSLFYNQNFYAQYKVKNLSTSVFARLIPNIRLRNGVFNGSGLLHASGGRPLVNGSLSLTGLDVVIPDINPTLGPLSANMRFVDSTVLITSLNARWGRGAVSAQGQTSWNMEKLSDLNLRVRASELFIELPDVVNVGVANADLQISDRNSDIVVNGKITMGPTSYVRDLNLIELVNQMQISAGVRRAPNPFLQSVQLQVALDLASNVGADMNLGALRMDGRLTIAGTADEPGLVGEIKIVDGFVYYLDRKFMISEGTLFNPDHSAVNPNIRIVAKTDISTFSPNARTEQFTITLSVSGTMENPVVRFTADPALSELDILSILTFGERMGGMGSDMNNRLMNIAAQQAIGFGTRRLEKLLSLDRVSVSGDLLGTGSSQSSGATIGVSKRFTSRLNITYETSTNTLLSDSKVTAQYRLLPNLYLEGLRTGEGESAVDLILRYSR